MRVTSVLAFLAVSISFAQPAHDVGVAEVLHPRGTVDSGQQVTPSVVVANYGTNTESLVVQMAIDQSGVEQYRDSLTISNLQPGSYDTVEFAAWIPEGRDSMTTIAWTGCAGDTFLLNDTARARFLVRVLCVKITGIFAPMDTLDSGAVVYPRLRVWNYGNQSKTFDVRFRILPDSLYYSVRSISLIAGGATLVTLPDSWVVRPGAWAALCSLVIPPDAVLDVWMDTFWGRGLMTHDVGVTHLSMSPPTPHVGDTVRFTAGVVNYGGGPETFWAFMSVLDSAHHLLFLDSVHLVWPDSMDVAWSYVFTEPAMYWAECSLYLAPDQNRLNDVRRIWFLVDPRPGVEESRQLTACSSQPEATVVRSALRLTGYRTQDTEHRAELLDACGRRVMFLKPGANDVSHLPCGVYFVRHAQAQAVSCHKVVIQR